MRLKLAGFLIAALLAPHVYGQTVTRMYSFTHVNTVQEFQEIANAMRTMSNVKDASTDNAQLTATVTGTPEQIGITDWLFKELDQPPQGQSPVTYNVSVDDVVELLYLPSTQSVQEFQELINGVRTILEIRYAFGDNAQHAFVVRAPAAQVVLAARLATDLSQPAPGSGVHQYQIAADDVMQVYYLTHAASVQDFQEIANGVRTIAEIRRVVAENSPRALVVRATPAQIAMATWLISEFDQPHAAPAAHSYTAGADDVVRVFYLPPTGTVQDFQATANKIRTTAQIRRAVGINTPRAFTVRGTNTQIAQADQMVQDLTPPVR
jgi:type II secretory pathway component GspD/PulD (secretin)